MNVRGSMSQSLCQSIDRVSGTVSHDRIRDQSSFRRAAREEGARSGTYPASPSSLTLSHTVNAVSQFISVCFSSVALSVITDQREERRDQVEWGESEQEERKETD